MTILARENATATCLHQGEQYIELLARLAFVILCCLPALYILTLITQAGKLPDNDYWDYLNTILRNGAFSLRFQDWFAHNTEHIVIIPKIFYVLNIKLTGGDNRALGLLGFSFAALEAVILLTFVRKYLTFTEKHWATLAICLLIFTPTAAHNWMLGMSGVAWIGANALALIAFYFLANRQVHLSCLVAMIGMLTYSTALGIWPALIVGALLAKHPLDSIKKILTYAFIASLLFLFFYHKPEGHPDLQRDPFTILTYLLTLTGGLFTSHDAGLAQKLAGAGLITLVFALWRLIKTPALWQASAIWLMIICYAMANMGIIAFARAGFGIEQALSSRYMTLPALFWLGWFGTILLLSRTLPLLRHWRFPVFFLLLAGFAYASIPAYGEITSYFLARSQKKTLAMVSIYTGGYDFDLLSQTVTPTLKTEAGRAIAAKLIPQLKKIRHIPFDGTFQHCPQPGEKLNITKQSPPGQKGGFTAGHFDRIELLDPLIYKVEGWARPIPSTPLLCIVITNQDKIVRGLALSGFPRPDVNQYLDKPGDYGWLGYARIAPQDKQLFAYVLTGKPLQWYPLSDTHAVFPSATTLNPLKK